MSGMFGILTGVVLLSCGDKEDSEDTSVAPRVDTGAVQDTGSATESDSDTATDTETDTGLEGNVANGQVVHDGRCIGCHENNPAMAQRVPVLSDAELEDVIQNGQGYMPPQGLSELQLIDVIAFLRQEYP